jgi:hypothetical protein
MEFQFDANGKLDWFFANMSQGGGDFIAASSRFDWNTRGPDSLDPSSSTGTGEINFEGWDTDIVFTEAELPILSPPPMSSPYLSPAALQVISPPPIEVLNADVDEHNIVHFHALEIRPSMRWKLLELQFKARQKNRRVNRQVPVLCLSIITFPPIPLPQ